MSQNAYALLEASSKHIYSEINLEWGIYEMIIQNGDGVPMCRRKWGGLMRGLNSQSLGKYIIRI